MTPEQKSRQQIDRQLELAGWIVQDYGQMNISAGLGVAVREFPLKTGYADYMLYADSKAIGVVEAKPKGHTLTGVETQSGKYLDGLPKILPNYLGSKQADIDRLLDHVSQMTTDEAELFATAYAAWNDLLINGRTANDDAIIAEKYGWHENKKRFKPPAIRARIG